MNYLFRLHAFTTYENESSFCCTLTDCWHYVDRNNGSKVMLWKICTSTSSFALNADSDPVMTVFKRNDTNETISLVNNFTEPKVELVASKEHIISLITARKRSLRRLCFYTCLSFCPQGGGWYPCMHCMWYQSMPCRSLGWGQQYQSMPCRSLGPHPREKLRGLACGGSPGPHSGGSPGPHQGEGIAACTEADPPSTWLLLRVVRILLECILVYISFLFISHIRIFYNKWICHIWQI